MVKSWPLGWREIASAIAVPISHDSYQLARSDSLGSTPSFEFWRDCWVRPQSRRLDDPLRQLATTLIRPAWFPALPEIWTSTSFPSAIRYLTRRSTE